MAAPSTDVEIVNLALRRLGCETITALSDTSKQAKLMTILYDTVRRTLLESYRWPFSLTRVEIAADATAPAFEFSARFALPALYLKAYEEFNEALWFREGEWLLSDATSLLLKYVQDITDVTKFSPSFIKVFYLELAHEASHSLTQDKELKGRIKAELAEAKADARFVASSESSPEVFDVTDFTDSRL